MLTEMNMIALSFSITWVVAGKLISLIFVLSSLERRKTVFYNSIILDFFRHRFNSRRPCFAACASCFSRDSWSSRQMCRQSGPHTRYSILLQFSFFQNFSLSVYPPILFIIPFGDIIRQQEMLFTDTGIFCNVLLV